MAARSSLHAGSGYRRSESAGNPASAFPMAGEGGYGFSFVLSFTIREPCGCSPGT